MSVQSTGSNDSESRPAAGLRFQFKQVIAELRDRSKQPDDPDPSTEGELVPEADSILVARRNSSLALLAKEVAKREDEARFEDSRIETRDDSEEEEGALSQDSRAAERREVIASLLDRSEQQERRAQKLRMLAEELMDIALVERTLGRMVLRQSQQLNEGKGEGISN